MNEQEVTLFVICDKWFKKGSIVCFEDIDEDDCEVRYRSSKSEILELRKNYYEKVYNDSFFCYEAIFNFPNFESMVDLIAKSVRGDCDLAQDILSRNAKIVNRIDPDEL